MNEIEQYIVNAARKRGMDPNKILEVVRTEGGTSDPFRQSDVVKNGRRERSYGPLQLYIDGGLGNEAMKAGIDPRSNWQGGIDFGLDHAAKNGWKEWYGPQNAGLPLDYGLAGAKPMGLTLNSNPGGYASEGPMAAAASRMAPPLDAPYSVADRPIGDAMPAQFDTAAAPTDILAKLKSFGGSDKGKDALSAIVGSFGGGQKQQAPQIQSGRLLAQSAQEDAARMGAAQQLMAQLMAGKKKKILGTSLMG